MARFWTGRYELADVRARRPWRRSWRRAQRPWRLSAGGRFPQARRDHLKTRCPPACARLRQTRPSSRDPRPFRLARAPADRSSVSACMPMGRWHRRVTPCARRRRLHEFEHSQVQEAARRRESDVRIAELERALRQERAEREVRAVPFRLLAACALPPVVGRPRQPSVTLEWRAGTGGRHAHGAPEGEHQARKVCRDGGGDESAAR